MERSTFVHRAAVALLLTIHAALVGYSATRNSPVRDEVGQLPSGISHWRYGRFELNRVNPPLVRMIAALPVLVAGSNEDWRSFDTDLLHRPEYAVGADFVQANRPRWLELYTMARWACLPLGVIGGWVCYRWSLALYGPRSALVALVLWCFCPNLIGYGQLIMSDAGAAAFGIAASYTFWRWLDRPSWPRAALAGAVLGLAELTKTTWTILFLLWPLLWLVWTLGRRGTVGVAGRQTHWKALGQLAAVLSLAVLVINAGYGLDGTFARLGSYPFVSRTLSGLAAGKLDKWAPANRFAGTPLAGLPVPLPRQYVQGIDVQRADFEHPKLCYLAGNWKRGGWWYYYVYLLAVKLPIGALLLVAAVVGLSLVGGQHSFSWRNDACVLAPALAVLVLVSSQTAINSHFRYVLPVVPFVYVWASKVGRNFDGGHRAVAWFCLLALAGFVVSSMATYPYSLSYANELVGGPRGARFHVAGSNIDWGQDLVELKRWADRHPQARPLFLAHDHILRPEWLAIPASELPAAPADDRAALPLERRPQLRPGWYAISADRLKEPGGQFASFEDIEPDAMAGYSIYIYNVAADGN